MTDFSFLLFIPSTEGSEVPIEIVQQRSDFSQLVNKPFARMFFEIWNLLFLLDSLFHCCGNALPERSARAMQASKDEAKSQICLHRNKKLPSLNYDHKPSSCAVISYLTVFHFELTVDSRNDCGERNQNTTQARFKPRFLKWTPQH